MGGRPHRQVHHRLRIYAGVRSHILGCMPQGFRVRKVRGHADVDAATSDRERFEAIGNDRADAVAKTAAAELRTPSKGELHEWEQQTAFLKAYLKSVPKALALWPAVGPSVGKRALPRRVQGGNGPRAGRRSQRMCSGHCGRGPRRLPTVKAEWPQGACK